MNISIAGKARKRLVGQTLKAVFLLSLLSYSDASFALLGDSEGAFGLDGSLRTLPALVQNYDFPPFFGEDNDLDQYSQTILRLTAAGRPSDLSSYEVHLVTNLTYFSGGTGSEAGIISVISEKTRYRALDDAWNLYRSDKVTADLWFDRFNLKIALPVVDITIGRQAITFGKAFFWNPLDVYAPFEAAQFDRDYKVGVDALRFDIPVSTFSGFTVVGVFGREIDLDGNYASHNTGALNASWYGSSVLGRFFTTFKGWDFAVQAGKIYGGYQIGGGLVGEVGPLEVRGEAAYLWAEERAPLPPPFTGRLIEDHFTAVVGLGHRFENTLVLEFEYLYNGGGEDDDLNTALLRLQSGAILQLSRHLVGFLATYDFLPILVGQLVTIYSLSDASALVQPILTLSMADNADLLLGASFNFGRRPDLDPVEGVQLESEFGAYPNFYFAQVKFYF